MRSQYSQLVEEGRNRTDPRFATKTGDLHGLFRIQSPQTGATLRILVGPGNELWQQDGMTGEPWDHVSVSKVSSCPTWEEMAFVKHLFFDDEETVVQYHPPKSKYVNKHEFVLHLWRPTVTPIPMPPLECV